MRQVSMQMCIRSKTVYVSISCLHHLCLTPKKWNIEEAGELVVRKHFASANNVKFSQGFQEIRVETEEG